jgi:hypothetical protein
MKFLKYFCMVILVVAFATVAVHAQEEVAEACAEAEASVGLLPLAAAFLAIPSAALISLRRKYKK